MTYRHIGTAYNIYTIKMATTDTNLFICKIHEFIENQPLVLREAVQCMVFNIINNIKYNNMEGLERHNWINKPVKLSHIPKYTNTQSFEEDLLNSLKLKNNQKSVIELVWGDVQCGKRKFTYNTMWILIYIYRTPVLYIFRNLTIDQTQLQDDLAGISNNSFNINSIKNIFKNYFNEDDDNFDYWKNYKLPEVTIPLNKNNINRLSNKDSYNPNDIYSCLSNHTQLKNINNIFSKYISTNETLAPIAVIIDEGDITCPTSSNDRLHKRNVKDTTLCEKYISTICKKTSYSIKITATPFSLLCNNTTTLSTNEYIVQTDISRVHVMKTPNNYYGLHNNSIMFQTSLIYEWWDKKNSYNIDKDYNINIKKVINNIINRPQHQNYNSLIINGERRKESHFILANNIINDFPDLFVIIYHGQCLRLYLPKIYEEEIKRLSKWEADNCNTSKRLWQQGGVRSISNNANNNYCYFNMDMEKINIKFIYKLLRILFEHSTIPITNKTVITITGVFGNRGYSFTSDDYNIYTFHLTDQYFITHTPSINLTNIDQIIRLQGIYNDEELKNGNMKLILWTLPSIQNIIQQFYINYNNKIKQHIMKCKNSKEIRELIESVKDDTEMDVSANIKSIVAKKQQKNITIHSSNSRNLYIDIKNMDNNQIYNLLYKEHGLDDNYKCINIIKELDHEPFIEKYGIWHYEIDINIKSFNSEIEYLGFIKKEKIPVSKCINRNRQDDLFYKTSTTGKPRIHSYQEILKCLDSMENSSNFDLKKSGSGEIIGKIMTRLYICYTDTNNPDTIKYILRIGKILDKYKKLPENTDDYMNGSPFVNLKDSGKIKFSSIKNEYNKTKPEKYYWKTIDDMLCIPDKNGPVKIIPPYSGGNNLTIEHHYGHQIQPIEPSPPPPPPPSEETTQLHNVNTYYVSNASSVSLRCSNIPTRQHDEDIDLDIDIIKLFIDECCEKTIKKRLRFGIKDIYTKFQDWCMNNKIEQSVKQRKFKKIFEEFGYKEEISQGLDINGKPGKRGYNIMLK